MRWANVINFRALDINYATVTGYYNFMISYLSYFSKKEEIKVYS